METRIRENNSRTETPERSGDRSGSSGSSSCACRSTSSRYPPSRTVRTCASTMASNCIFCGVRSQLRRQLFSWLCSQLYSQPSGPPRSNGRSTPARPDTRGPHAPAAHTTFLHWMNVLLLPLVFDPGAFPSLLPSVVLTCRPTIFPADFSMPDT